MSVQNYPLNIQQLSSLQGNNAGWQFRMGKQYHRDNSNYAKDCSISVVTVLHCSSWQVVRQPIVLYFLLVALHVQGISVRQIEQRKFLVKRGEREERRDGAQRSFNSLSFFFLRVGKLEISLIVQYNLLALQPIIEITESDEKST